MPDKFYGGSYSDNIPDEENDNSAQSAEDKMEAFLKTFTRTNPYAKDNNHNKDIGGNYGYGGDGYDRFSSSSFRVSSWEEPSEDIARTRLSDFNEVAIDSATEDRIERLQEIIYRIEKKALVPKQAPPLPNASAYKIDYHKSLNAGQFMAATTLNGPVMVLAGAGSGKTRTVIYRLSFMLENGILPTQILLLTFTRKASLEMVHRAAGLLKDRSADAIMATTYHSFANIVLRRYAPMINLSPNFTIIDTIDSEDSIDLIRNELKLNKQNKAFPKKDRIAEIISRSRNCNMSIKSVIEREYRGLTEYISDLQLVATTYQRYKAANQILDYDDLMDKLRDALRDNLEFRRTLQAQYRYLMIDEFQDTNVVQKQIIDYLAEASQNIMVVGDDAQSIYAFRGANFENILTFPETYPKCSVIKLEQNYRSNQDILRFTNDIANRAVLGYKKALFSDIETPFMPVIGKFHDQQDEAQFIVHNILSLRERGIPLNQIAVLYRSSFHSNYIQTELLKRSIPYIMIGGIKFTEKRHIKDTLAFLRLILNPIDAVSWNRILKLIPGVGSVTARKVVTTIHEQQGKFDFTDFEKQKFGGELLKLGQMLAAAADPTISVPTKIEIVKHYYTPLLQLLEHDYEIRLQDIDVLYDIACKYEELEKFLSDFALEPPSNKFQDQVRPLLDETEDKPLTLSTIHSSKGLEWYAVFVPHLLDGLFPSSRSMKNIEMLEEERRLFYVAASRAKQELYLTMPAFVSQWDNYYTMPSRFIIELNRDNYCLYRRNT